MYGRCLSRISKVPQLGILLFDMHALFRLFLNYHLANQSLGRGQGIQVCLNKGTRFFPTGDYKKELNKIIYNFKKNYLQTY